MKRNIAIALTLFLFLAISGSLLANPAGKKKKKKKKETTEQIAAADTAAAKASADSATAAMAAAKAVDDVDTSAKVPYAMLADTSSESVGDFTLDTTRPVDGFYKQTTLKGAKPFALPTTTINNIKKYKRLMILFDNNN